MMSSTYYFLLPPFYDNNSIYMRVCAPLEMWCKVQQAQVFPAIMASSSVIGKKCHCLMMTNRRDLFFYSFLHQTRGSNTNIIA